MAGGISFEFTDVLGRQAKKKRQAEAAALSQSLLEKGASPDAVNTIAEQYVKTGQVKVPQYQTKMLAPTTLFPEGIPAREPFALSDKKKGLFGFDAATGKFSDASGQQINQLPEGVTPDVRTWSSQPLMGEDIYVDPTTGQEIRRVPNRGKTNKSVVLPKPSTGGGAGKESPDVTLAKGVIATIKKLEADGIEVPPELVESGKSAAEVLGNVSVETPTNTVVDQPGFIPRLFGAKPTTRTEQGAPVVKFNKPGASPTPKLDPAKVAKATAWLQSVKKPVTDANIAAAIKAGKGD